MGILDGQPVDAANSNPAWLDANGDDVALGKIGFHNTAPESGGLIDNTQRVQNRLMTATGVTENTDTGMVYYAPTNTIVDGESHRASLTRLANKLDKTAGHTHSGVDGDGGPVTASFLINVPLKGYVQNGLNLLARSGASTDVSTEMSTKVASTGSTAIGVVVTGAYNKIILRQITGTNAGDKFVDAYGNEVYGRLTEAASVWTLTFYVMIGAVETSYTFATATDIGWYYQELFNPMLNPPVYSEYAVTPSDNTTQDVIQATQTEYGKTILQNSTAAAIASASTIGTANGRVANADHTHEGVHSVKIYGDVAEAKGDVEFEAGTMIGLSWNSGRLKIDNLVVGTTLGWQEQIPGIVNGVNPTFGPLSYLPCNDKAILVLVDGISVPITTGYTVAGATVTFQPGYIPQVGQDVYAYYITVGTPPTPVVSGQLLPEYRTITSGEATAKSLTLSNTPAVASRVMLDIIGGSAQFFGLDYTVTGTTLSWAGLRLDGILSSGDEVRITYVY